MFGRKKPQPINVHVLPTAIKSPTREAIHSLSELINEDTQAVGYFVLQKSGNIFTGCSYDAGFTPVHLLGSCDLLKTEMFERIWGNHGKNPAA